MAELRFKLDENIARDAVPLLRARGHDVQTVKEENLTGEPDATIAAVCQRKFAYLSPSISTSPT